jgi:RHH-type proline utilization regulon transcriptional repressor/proline dehydrogenase/delta 1-pyrroline-5-carboxylate dehydrogenase
MPPSFATDHLQDEQICVEALLESLRWDGDRARRTALQADMLIRAVRARKSGVSEIETFLEQYPLSSDEGLALMTLAEALLRIPDNATADALIAEKMAAASWSTAGTFGLLKLAGVGLGLAQKTLGSFLGDVGRPVIRKSMTEAIKRIGAQFVVGESIQKAITNARKHEGTGYRMSYDMLGEGARTRTDADRYFAAYETAIDTIGRTADQKQNLHQKPGISVKLSALHPRYNWAQREHCVPEMTELLTQLCLKAAAAGIALTVDAEEADRLEMHLEILRNVAAKPELKHWPGLGLAVQAYDKRCLRVVDDVAAIASGTGRILQVRLVKGAYWDTEIKRAQVNGLPGYPVFTNKHHTDLSYIACAAKLMGYRQHLYPMFATHNAQTVAAVLELAGQDKSGFEFQRLFGMGEALGDVILTERLAPVTIYAPVGTYEDLLAYLVRRMLENGANTSFLNKIRSKTILPEELTVDPVIKSSAASAGQHSRIPSPPALYGGVRQNSAGYDISDSATRHALLQQIISSASWRDIAITPIIAGEWPIKSGGKHVALSPINSGEQVAEIWDTTADKISEAMNVALKGFSLWHGTPATERADCLRRYADLLELQTPRLIGILQHEGGKTLNDAIAEIREAVDFCRYYAAEGEDLFGHSELLPGPTGEENTLSLEGRGVFICISPWNFPLAIFTGQIAAALMAGNSVIAKPAEQTPVIAFEAVRLMLEAGIPKDVITLLPGDGRIGAALVEHPRVAGVAFTGSTEVARSINRTLAAKDGPIVPLIAETGGQNAMIVDSTALPEQVIDDVILSAFGSAGQRCSALRVLYVQDDIADKVISLLRGGMSLLRVGDPRDIATDVGPVIDQDALKSLQSHIDTMAATATLIERAPVSQDVSGYYVAPIAFEIKNISQLKREVFGPVLHVIRYPAEGRDRVVEEINSTGFGLTCGIHSRLSARSAGLGKVVKAGNIYINRSMIGAVVGVQPFGGMGLSGTGPKAGGPYYLHRFATEKVTSINTTATGGNIALISSIEE